MAAVFKAQRSGGAAVYAEQNQEASAGYATGALTPISLTPATGGAIGDVAGAGVAFSALAALQLTPATGLAIGGASVTCSLASVGLLASYGYAGELGVMNAKVAGVYRVCQVHKKVAGAYQPSQALVMRSGVYT